MMNILPYHVWLSVYQDELADREEDGKSLYEVYQEYRDSFYEGLIETKEYLH